MSSDIASSDTRKRQFDDKAATLFDRLMPQFASVATDQNAGEEKSETGHIGVLLKRLE
jgi:hypothetical protein